MTAPAPTGQPDDLGGCNEGNCEEPAEHQATVGCVHEHVRDVVWCPECYADALQGFMLCGPCLLQARGHEHDCELRVLTVAVR